jgi:hypothetical protein
VNLVQVNPRKKKREETEGNKIREGASLSVQSGFYGPTELVTRLQTICVVTYDRGKLNWTLGAGVSIVTIATIMREILGLALNSTGTFSTQLYLASPMNIDFISSQIIDTNGYSGRDSPMNNQPFL